MKELEIITRRTEHVSGVDFETTARLLDSGNMDVLEGPFKAIY